MDGIENPRQQCPGAAVRGGSVNVDRQILNHTPKAFVRHNRFAGIITNGSQGKAVPQKACPSRIFMQPWVDSNDGVRERLEIRQFGRVWLSVPDDRPAHPGLKNDAFATDDNSPGTRTAVV